MTFKLFSKHKKATNGGVMPESEYLVAIQEIPPTNYEELIIKLKQSYPNNQLVKTYYHGHLDEVLMQESPMIMQERVQEIKNLVGKKWLVRWNTNTQNIHIKLINK